VLGALARLAAIGTAGAAYVLAVRPQLQRWGATEAEAAERLPGDDLVPVPRFASTRAIDIAAPPSAVWPWLVQLGEGRGGWYTYEALERAVGLGMASSDAIVPELQDLAVDDRVRLAPIGGADGLVLTVRQLVAPELLVFSGGAPVEGDASEASGDSPRRLVAGDYFSGAAAASWALVLRDLDGDATRLLSRWRLAWAPSGTADLLHGVLVEPLHFALEERMLRGVRDRVERLDARPVDPAP
jgi:hypothetical protein